MKVRASLALSLIVTLLAANAALARAPKKYQATGTVLELADDLIVIQKGDEKWEIARDKATKVTGDLKVGGKVTIEYRMAATDVEVKKDDAKPAKDKK